MQLIQLIPKQTHNTSPRVVRCKQRAPDEKVIIIRHKLLPSIYLLFFFSLKHCQSQYYDEVHIAVAPAEEKLN